MIKGDPENPVFVTKQIFEVSKEHILSLMKFFKKHNVKIIEKDDEVVKEKHQNRHSGRSSLRQSQSIASSHRKEENEESD